MTTLENYLHNSNWLRKYHDQTIKDYVCDFIREQYEGAYEEKPSSAYIAMADLSGFLSSRKIDDITVADIVNYANTNKKKSIRTLALFLSFLVKNGCFYGTPITRLYDFERYFSATAATVKKIEYLLSMDETDYQLYLNSPLYKKRNERDGYSVFFFTINRNYLKADGIELFMEKYISQYKWSSEDSPRYMMRHLEGVNFCASLLFSNPGTIFVKANDVKKVMEEANRKYKPPTPAQIRVSLFRLLSSMNENGFPMDRNTVCAAKIANNFRVSNRTLLDEIIASEHPERYILYTTVTGTHVGNGHCVLVNTSSVDIQKALVSFLSQYASEGVGNTSLCRYFEDSFKTKAPSDLQELTYTTYLEQIDFFRSFKEKNLIIATLTAFYLYVQQNYVTDLFSRSGIPDRILQLHNIWSLILDGYSVVVHNPLETVPKADKWILCHFQSRNNDIIDIKSIDFTMIECDVFREWEKTYIWHADVKMETKRHPFFITKEVLNYLFAIKKGTVLTIFTKSHTPLDTVTTSEAAAVRNYVFSLHENARTRAGYIYGLRNLLKYVADNNLGKIEPGVFHTLAHVVDNDYDNTMPIPDDELRILINEMLKRATENNLMAIYFSAVYIILETELRGATVLGLQKNCIRETAKKGEYVLAVEEKTSAGEIVYHPVTNYVVREIREIIKRTEEYHQQCTDPKLANTLFIVPSQKKGTFCRLVNQTLNRYLKNCCKSAGISLYTISNLRDTHMTNVMRYKVVHQLSDIEQSVLSGHKDPKIDDVHYVRLDIRDMLEATNGIIIGDASIKGTVENDHNQPYATPDNLVSHNCGYCKSEACGELSYIDCLICHDFVTMPSRLPFFKERIAIIDEQIKKSNVPHDKEDLITIKKLLVMYVEKIMEMMEADNNATN